jgi:Family of unknown function (DUF6496)
LIPYHKSDVRPVQNAKRELREGKSAKTAAGEFVHEEIEHVRQGKHGARSPRQAIAIGLSEARRAGISVLPPKKNTRAATKKTAERGYKKGQSSMSEKKTSNKRSKARIQVMQREPKNTASHVALSRHAKAIAKRRKRTSSRTAT